MFIVKFVKLCVSITNPKDNCLICPTIILLILHRKIPLPL